MCRVHILLRTFCSQHKSDKAIAQLNLIAGGYKFSLGSTIALSRQREGCAGGGMLEGPWVGNSRITLQNPIHQLPHESTPDVARRDKHQLLNGQKPHEHLIGIKNIVKNAKHQLLHLLHHPLANASHSPINGHTVYSIIVCRKLTRGVLQPWGN